MPTLSKKNLHESKTDSAGVSAASRTQNDLQQPQKDVGRYIFFDFEREWQQQVSDDFELDLSMIENELIVNPLVTQPSFQQAQHFSSQLMQSQVGSSMQQSAHTN